MNAKMGKPKMHDTMGITMDSGDTEKTKRGRETGREREEKYIKYIIISLKELL